jgi:hypothetical protein
MRLGTYNEELGQYEIIEGFKHEIKIGLWLKEEKDLIQVDFKLLISYHKVNGLQTVFEGLNSIETSCIKGIC